MLEFSVRARSSMHAASVARNLCEQPPDPRRRIRVIPGGKASYENGAALHNGKLPCYFHSLHSVCDWELMQCGICTVTLAGGDTTLRNLQAGSLMESVGHAILHCQSKGLELGPLKVRIGRYRDVTVDPEEYWSWLMSDTPSPDHEQRAKAILRDRHAIPLTRQERRARQER